MRSGWLHRRCGSLRRSASAQSERRCSANLFHRCRSGPVAGRRRHFAPTGSPWPESTRMDQCRPSSIARWRSKRSVGEVPTSGATIGSGLVNLWRLRGARARSPEQVTAGGLCRRYRPPLLACCQAMRAAPFATPGVTTDGEPRMTSTFSCNFSRRGAARSPMVAHFRTRARIAENAQPDISTLRKTRLMTQSSAASVGKAGCSYRVQTVAFVGAETEGQRR
jgi:hypothetical protein